MVALWRLIGGAVTAALRGTEHVNYLWGLVPVAVGIANLLSYWIERRRPREPQTPAQP